MSERQTGETLSCLLVIVLVRTELDSVLVSIGLTDGQYGMSHMVCATASVCCQLFVTVTSKIPQN